MGLVIRDFKEEDRQWYLSLSNEFFNSSAVLHPVPMNLLERNFDNLIKASKLARGLAIEYDSHSCGYAVIAFSYSTAVAGKVLWIEDLCISKKYRGQGIGTSFFKWLFSEYGDKVDRFRLETAPENESVRKLYKSLGFNAIEYRQMVCDMSDNREGKK